MTSTRKSYSGFTEEEKAVLKRIYKVKAQISKEIRDMSFEEELAYLRNIEAPVRGKRSRKKIKTGSAKTV